jgi:hypothetical protein
LAELEAIRADELALKEEEEKRLAEEEANKVPPVEEKEPTLEDYYILKNQRKLNRD